MIEKTLKLADMSSGKKNGGYGNRPKDDVLNSVRRSVELLRLEVEYMELLQKRKELSKLFEEDVVEEQASRDGTEQSGSKETD